MITSPNVLITLPKMDNLHLTILHGLIFLFIVYFTEEFVVRYREGVKIGSIEINSNESDLHMSTNLGLDKLNKINTSPEQSNVVNVNNTILDYTRYNNNKLKDNDPLPGPVPKFFDNKISDLSETEQVEPIEQVEPL